MISVKKVHAHVSSETFLHSFYFLCHVLLIAGKLGHPHLQMWGVRYILPLL